MILISNALTFLPLPSECGAQLENGDGPGPIGGSPVLGEMSRWGVGN